MCKLQRNGCLFGERQAMMEIERNKAKMPFCIEVEHGQLHIEYTDFTYRYSDPSI